MGQASLTRRGFLAGTAAAACGVLAASSLSGCASGDDVDDEDDEPSPEAGDEANEPTEASVITAAVAYSATEAEVSPVGNSSALMLPATRHVFEGLYDLDMHTYKPYNALAASEPSALSDTEYEITLRDGAKFSDGSDVTADDVVNAFMQNMADATYGPLLTFIDTVEAQDDKTVVLMLNYPFDALLERRLSLVKIFPSAQTDEDLARMPIGSGPWAYGDIDGTDGGCVTFDRNARYNGAYPAACAHMEWNVILDAAARGNAVANETVQAMENVSADTPAPHTDLDETPTQVADLIETITEAGATVEYVPGFSLPFLMFNTRKAPFDDRRVRQAIFYALDTDKLIANEMEGHASAATSLLPETNANYHRASTVYTLDPDKSRSLLAEAGLADFSFDLLVNSGWVSKLSTQIQEDLEAVGITATVDEATIDWTTLAESEEILPYDVILSAGDPSCFGNDPDLLMTWWYGDNDWTAGRSCWKGTGAWSELQTLLQQAREIPDDNAQQDLWNQCLDIIAEEVPLYPLFHREIATAWWADKLKGFSPISTTGLVFLDVSAYE